MKQENSELLPAVFLSHGSPMTVLDQGPYSKALAEFGRSVNSTAIVMISAHWQEPGIQIASGAHPKLIYDFGGFPPELYQLKYDAPGSPALASEIATELKRAGFEVGMDAERGWDHGVWVPLRLMFPKGKIPVVVISLPMRWSPEELYNVGKALGGLRSKGVLVLGSGGVVHNLRMMNWRDQGAATDEWAWDFQEWVKQRVAEHDWETLFGYEKLAPNAALAVPTPEHFAPLFPVLGAAGESAKLVPIFEGIEHGNMSMFSFAMVG